MIDKIIEKVKSLCSWLSFLLVMLITVDVFLRYIFNFSSASLYELEWHFFAAIFLLGSSVTLQNDEHVRVDVFYNRLSKKNKEVINLIGNIFFLVPFSLVIHISIPFVTDSFVILESSPDQVVYLLDLLLNQLFHFHFLLATIE